MVAVVACAGLGGEADRYGPLAHPPGDPDPPPLVCRSGAAEPGCTPPQALIVLDRSSSMVLRPDGSLPLDPDSAHAESKWRRAIDAIESAVRGEAAGGVAFGLEVFPHDPGEGTCATIEAIYDNASLHAACRPGALLVPPCLGTNADIERALDVATTTLCGDTPIAGALGAARETLAAMGDSSQAQYVILVTDGGDNCEWQQPAVDAARELRRDGVHLFAVGFGGYGVDPEVLSDLACVGGTAFDAEVACTDPDSADALWDRNATYPFLDAEDGPALEVAITDIAAAISCLQIR
ncbi:MAG: VWA domain-containing protein [Polyangiaceae bacterium]|nr:VWA domain-containing protein [Polyangiaceae bacterium]